MMETWNEHDKHDKMKVDQKKKSEWERERKSEGNDEKTKIVIQMESIRALSLIQFN